MTKSWLSPIVVIFALLVPTTMGQSATRYCFEGLTVRSAQKALESGDSSAVLIWVGKDREAEVRAALEKAKRIRELSPEAREVADGYFIQTLNCLHQLSAGRKQLPREAWELGPAVPSAEKAVETNSLDLLTILLMDMMRQETQRRFKEVMDRKKYDPKDMEAGRRYAQSYAAFIEYVDQVYSSIRGNR